MRKKKSLALSHFLFDPHTCSFVFRFSIIWVNIMTHYPMPLELALFLMLMRNLTMFIPFLVNIWIRALSSYEFCPCIVMLIYFAALLVRTCLQTWKCLLYLYFLGLNLCYQCSGANSKNLVLDIWCFHRGNRKIAKLEHLICIDWTLLKGSFHLFQLPYIISF